MATQKHLKSSYYPSGGWRRAICTYIVLTRKSLISLIFLTLVEVYLACLGNSGGSGHLFDGHFMHDSYFADQPPINNLLLPPAAGIIIWFLETSRSPRREG